MARLSERPRRDVKSNLTGNAAAAGHRRWDSRCRDGAERPSTLCIGEVSWRAAAQRPADA